MEIDLKSPEVQFALKLIQFSSELACRVRAGSSVKTLFKKDRSPVTLADFGIQAIAGALFEQYFPEAVLVAEEDTDYLKTPEGAKDLEEITGLVRSFFPHAESEKVCQWIDKGRGIPASSFWTLDPIDGTQGFLREGQPSISNKSFKEGEARPSLQGGQYAIALAFIRDGRVELAAMGCPELELQDSKFQGKGVGIFAARGLGCWAFSLKDPEDPKRWVRLHVSQCHEMERAHILDSFDPQHRNVEQNQRIREMLGIAAKPVFMDSLAKHAVIAAGDAEIFFRTLSRKQPGYREKIWDVAAGALAIEEAGGRITDLEGRELDFGAGLTLAKNPGLIATNGFLHEAVLKALQWVMKC